MTRQKIETHSFTTDQGKEFRLEYLLLVDTLNDASGVSPIESYGVRVEAECDGKIYSSQFRNITTNSKRIYGLINLLSKGYVTPISLGDILDEWIG